MRRARTAILVVLALGLVSMLLEWTVTIVDPLKISRFSDFRALAEASSFDRGRPVLTASAELRVRDGTGDVAAAPKGERFGLLVPPKPDASLELVAVGSGLAFGYGVRPGGSFLMRAAGELGAGLRVHAHPFATREHFPALLNDVGFTSERDAEIRRVLLLVDRLEGGLSPRLQAIRDGSEERSWFAGLWPSIAQVGALIAGQPEDERGGEELGSLRPVLDALSTRAAELGAIPVYVDTGADDGVEVTCEAFGIRRASLLTGEGDGVALHPLTGYPDSSQHSGLSSRLVDELQRILGL